MTVLGKSWGPHTWYLLHMISFTWNKNKIPIYRKFFNLLKETIPCYTCYKNFKKKLSKPENFIENNIHDKEKMIRWVIHLHNLVNKSKGTRTYNYDQVLNMYLVNGNIIFNHNRVRKFIIEPFLTL